MHLDDRYVARFCGPREQELQHSWSIGRNSGGGTESKSFIFYLVPAILLTTTMAAVDTNTASDSESFFADILKPGSSFHPTFLAVVDGVLAVLLAVLLSLAIMTAGNIHLIFLTVIELALWASVKW
jgi:hypothetical protein